MNSSISSFPNPSSDQTLKPVYLITENPSQKHIAFLLDIFRKNILPVKVQKEKDSLGITPKEKCFVVVDNKKGVITLGSQFSSPLMFIVGYPQLGPNKKNHYCTTPQEVMQKYCQFYKLSDSFRSFDSPPIGKNMSKIELLSSSQTLQLTNSFQENNENMTNDYNFEKINSDSKLFLYLKTQYKTLRKYIFRIASCHPIKFIVVEDIQDLDLSLSVIRTKNNYILTQYQNLSEVLSLEDQEFKILLFCQPSIQIPIEITQNKRIISIIHSCQDIIKEIRKIGFQIVSIKDLQKSIVKYDNPIANQSTIKSSKKLNWIDSDDSKVTRDNLIKLKDEEIFNYIQSTKKSQMRQSSIEKTQMSESRSKFSKRTIRKLKSKKKDEKQGQGNLQKINQQYCLNIPKKRQSTLLLSSRASIISLQKNSQKGKNLIRARINLPKVTIKLNPIKRMKTHNIEPIFEQVKSKQYPIRLKRTLSKMERIYFIEGYQKKERKRSKTMDKEFDSGCFTFQKFPPLNQKKWKPLIFYKQFNYEIEAVSKFLKKKYSQLTSHTFSSPIQLKHKIFRHSKDIHYSIILLDDLGLQKFSQFFQNNSTEWQSKKLLILIFPKFSKLQKFMNSCRQFTNNNENLEERIFPIRVEANDYKEEVSEIVNKNIY